MKLFILTKPPKDDLFKLLPFLLGFGIRLVVETKIKNGVELMKIEENQEELY
jgi:hypothetical protein